jgi:hypothetical protein
MNEIETVPEDGESLSVPKVSPAEALNILQWAYYDGQYILDQERNDVLKNYLLNCHGLGSDPRVCMVTLWCADNKDISDVMERIRKRFGSKKIRRTAPKMLWAIEHKPNVPEGESGRHYHLLIGWNYHDTRLRYIQRLFGEMQEQGFFQPSRKGRRAWEVSTSRTTGNPYYRLKLWDELREAYNHLAYICKIDEQADGLEQGQRRFSGSRLRKLYREMGPKDLLLPRPPHPNDPQDNFPF